MPTAIVVIESGDPGVEYRKVKGFIGHAVGDDGSVWTCWTRVGKGIGANGGRYSGKTCGWTWELGSTWTKRKPCQIKRGYMVVSLLADLGTGAKRQQKYVHDLVLTAFVGDRPNGHEACHYPDRTPMNCRRDNLRWGTKSENRQDSIKHGTHARGESTGTAVLTEANVVEIISRFKKPYVIARLAKEFKVGESAIRRIRDNETWQHVPRN